MTLSRTEKIVLAYSRTVTGTLSFICSALILNKIILSSRKRRENIAFATETTEGGEAATGAGGAADGGGAEGGNNTNNNGTNRNFGFIATTSTYQRILFGLSLLDMMYSFWAALSTLPVPASSGAVFGHGTTMTCSVQGFFTQFTAATPVYIAALTTYFMLRIRYQVSEETLRKKYEVWFHILPITVAVGGAIVGVSLQIFNPIALPELGCWVAPYPRGCHLDPGTCTRGYKIGEYTDYYAWLLAFTWFFVSFFVVFINNVLIYTYILQQERRKTFITRQSQNQRSDTEVFSSSATTSEFPMPDSRDGAEDDGMMDNDDDDDHHSDLSNSEGVEGTTTSDARAQQPEGAINRSHSDDDDRVSRFSIVGRETITSTTSYGNNNNNHSSNQNHEAIRSSRRMAQQQQQQHERNRRLRRSVKTSRIAAVQGLLYVTTALMTTVWSVMPWIGKKIGVTTQTRFFFAFMVNIFNPAQGIFNLIIFVRLQYLRLRVTNPEWSRLQCIKFCLFSPDTK